MSTDEQLAETAKVNPVAALMWPWFITGFNDWGRMINSPMKIKLNIFQAFPYSDEDISVAIALYTKHGLVHLYTINGHNYMAIDPEKWFYWQNYIHKEKRTVDKSSIPAPIAPPWEQSSGDERKPAELSGDERDSVPSSLPPFLPSKDDQIIINSACAREQPVTKDLIELYKESPEEFRRVYPGAYEALKTTGLILGTEEEEQNQSDRADPEDIEQLQEQPDKPP